MKQKSSGFVLEALMSKWNTVLRDLQLHFRSAGVVLKVGHIQVSFKLKITLVHKWQ